MTSVLRGKMKDGTPVKVTHLDCGVVVSMFGPDGDWSTVYTSIFDFNGRREYSVVPKHLVLAAKDAAVFRWEEDMKMLAAFGVDVATLETTA